MNAGLGYPIRLGKGLGVALAAVDCLETEDAFGVAFEVADAFGVVDDTGAVERLALAGVAASGGPEQKVLKKLRPLVTLLKSNTGAMKATVSKVLCDPFAKV
jgi:hypothetical protein